MATLLKEVWRCKDGAVFAHEYEAQAHDDALAARISAIQVAKDIYEEFASKRNYLIDSSRILAILYNNGFYKLP